MNLQIAQSSSAPRIVFLIDRHHLLTDEHGIDLKIAILRILRYYHDHVHNQVTWGYPLYLLINIL